MAAPTTTAVPAPPAPRAPETRRARRDRNAPVLSGAARFRRWWVPYLWAILPAVLVQNSVPAIGVFRSLFYVPAIASVVVVALAWSFLLKDNGSINELLVSLGVVDGPVPFLTQRWWLLASSMAVSVWKGLP